MDGWIVGWMDGSMDGGREGGRGGGGGRFGLIPSPNCSKLDPFLGIQCANISSFLVGRLRALALAIGFIFTNYSV